MDGMSSPHYAFSLCSECKQCITTNKSSYLYDTSLYVDRNVCLLLECSSRIVNGGLYFYYF
jgi:hypothetical protein